ncbi:MAG: sulfotransferase family 2 domain-containing protein [Rhodovarius sp.]|nr:sulfotransferase family protein [Rhodovarius sp.]MDW8314063.1 sulfotransferase family 2 domain-containing protein [Rhodovarius sp.]
MLISIHIPKTAGTLLGYILDHGLGRRVLWDYSDDYSAAENIQPELADHLDFIKIWFRGIHGHFFYSKWAAVFPDAKFITCLRHPVDRIISQYKHDLADALSGRRSWLHDPLGRGEMDIVDYVQMSPDIGRAMVNHLRGRDIKEYDFIFLTEDIEQGLEVFCKLFNFHRQDPFEHDVPFINTSSAREIWLKNADPKIQSLFHVNDEQKRKLFDLIPEEVDLYQRATEHYNNVKKSVIG